MSAKKGVLGVVVVGLLAAAVFLVPTLWGKPWSIDHFYGRVFLQFALVRPQMLSQLRILEPYGLDSHADDLDDYSVAFELSEAEKVREDLEILRRYDRDSLTPSQRLSYDVLEWFLAALVEGEPYLFHSFEVNPTNGMQADLPDFMINVHQIGSKKEAQAYVTRLSQFARVFDEVSAGLDHRADQGVVPPRYVLTQVRDELAAFRGQPPNEHFLYRVFVDSISELPDVSESEREQLAADALAAVTESVYPAYAELDEELGTLEQNASDAIGAWSLPDGLDYYQWALYLHTTTRLTAEEIYDLGLAEVTRVTARIMEILAEQGIPARDLASGIAALRSDPRFSYEDSAAGREEILTDYREIVEQARVRMPDLFGRLPEAELVVDRVPEFRQLGAPIAHYQPPPFDGSRPGVFFANLRNVAEHQKWRMRTLAHHEALPGHHLQIALAQEMTDAPFFRRVLPFSAFSEGWALYAERLAAEQGLLPTPWDELGMLLDELFRAVRLVVDTGIHSRHWSRANAIKYMSEATGKPRSEVEAEVDRYVVMPGQACAYKVGQLQILALRDRAKNELGDAFDLREFHDVVLGGGALPLEILGRVVDEWIASKGGGARG